MKPADTVSSFVPTSKTSRRTVAAKASYILDPALANRSSVEIHLLINMTFWATRVGSRLILVRSGPQLEFDSGIGHKTITSKHNKLGYPSLIDRLAELGDIKILPPREGVGCYEILRPAGPTRDEVPSYTDRLLELIRSWVKEGLIHLSEVSALQGLASLAVEAERPDVRGDYQEIARRRGMKEASVWDALDRARRKLGAE